MGTKSSGKINILKSVYERICAEGGYDSKALASWMKQNGYTETTKDRYFKNVKIGGSQNWCVCIISNSSKDELDFIPVDREKLPWDID